MAINKLTARQVQNAKPGVHQDGGNLRLIVKPTGSRSFSVRFTLNGKRCEMGLGSIDLAEARRRRGEVMALVHQGIDPRKARDEAAKQAREASAPTFAEYAKRYIDKTRPEWRSAKHAKQWENTLETYAYPVIGKTPVDQITPDQVLEILQAKPTPDADIEESFWYVKTETAKRVQGRIEKILDYATVNKDRHGDNPARWRNFLSVLLPSPSKISPVEHHPALPIDAMPDFWELLDSYDQFQSDMVRLYLMTNPRVSNIINAKWTEFDLTNGIWVIPGPKMKGFVTHRVPLTTQAIALLENLPRLEGNPYLFPGCFDGRERHENIMNVFMRKTLGYGKNGGPRGTADLHGLRSSFVDWAHERTNFSGELIELAQAHRIRNKAERAYRRGDQLEKRRPLMQAWADFLTRTQPAENVTPINQAAS